MTPMTNPRARAARGLVAAAVLAVVGMACTGGNPDSTPFPSPSGHPTPFDAEKVQTTTPIKHVVFIIKENRSFDNLFGRFPGADGTTVADDHGTMRPLGYSPTFTQRM